MQPREGEDRLVSASFAADGSVGELNVPSRVRLAATSLWRVAREVRCDAGPAPPKIEQTLEDTPFYARSLVQMPLSGERVLAVHETLDVRRLSSVAVQGMLPFRMPRRR